MGNTTANNATAVNNSNNTSNSDVKTFKGRVVTPGTATAKAVDSCRIQYSGFPAEIPAVWR